MLQRYHDRRASQIIAQAQDIVSSHGPHPNYDELYRPQETSYWSHLPGWILRDQRKARACLDVGPGYGTLMVFCRLATGAEVYGLDFDPVYMTEGLHALEGIHWAEGNIELDPVPWPGPFDFIVFSEIIEHLNFQAVPTLRKLTQLLAPGGRVYLSTPDSASWGRTTVYYDEYAELPLPSEELRDDIVDDHVWQFSWAELTEVLDDAGMRVLRSASAPGTGGAHFNLTLDVIRGPATE